MIAVSAATPAPILVPACEGRTYELGDHCAVCKVSAEDTGGAFSLFEVYVDPDGGPPPHIHTREDETFWVLEGRFAFLVGSQEFEAGPGACVFGPRGHAHGWRNISAGTARMLTLITPAGFETFFAEIEAMGGASPEREPANMPELVSLLHRYGLGIPQPPR